MRRQALGLRASRAFERGQQHLRAGRVRGQFLGAVPRPPRGRAGQAWRASQSTEPGLDSAIDEGATRGSRPARSPAPPSIDASARPGKARHRGQGPSAKTPFSRFLRSKTRAKVCPSTGKARTDTVALGAPPRAERTVRTRARLVVEPQARRHRRRARPPIAPNGHRQAASSGPAPPARRVRSTQKLGLEPRFFLSHAVFAARTGGGKGKGRRLARASRKPRRAGHPHPAAHGPALREAPDQEGSARCPPAISIAGARHVSAHRRGRRQVTALGVVARKTEGHRQGSRCGTGRRMSPSVHTHPVAQTLARAIPEGPIAGGRASPGACWARGCARRAGTQDHRVGCMTRGGWRRNRSAAGPAGGDVGKHRRGMARTDSGARAGSGNSAWRNDWTSKLHFYNIES